MCVAPHPRGNCLQQGMVPADGPCWKRNSWTWPRKRHTQIQIYALLLPGQGNGQLQERSLQGSQKWVQNGLFEMSEPPSLKTGELQTLMQEKEGPVPFNLQLLPLHYCEGHSNPYDKKIFKAEVTAPLQSSMLDATKFMLFYTCSLGLLIFSFQDHWGFVWWFLKACFLFYVVVIVLCILAQETKSLSSSSINKNLCK